MTLQEIEKVRQERGLEIAKAKETQVSRNDDTTYKVLSQTGNGSYLVSLSEDRWVCGSPDYKLRALKCKHRWAVENNLKLKGQVRKNTVIEEVTISKCVFCYSENIKKFGTRHNNDGDIQCFVCGACGRTFSVNIGFEKMKHDPQAVPSAIQLYFSGESLRNIMRSLRLLGVGVSHQTVYNWIDKYVKLMKEHVRKLTPNVGDTWRTDELYVKIKGDVKYLFAAMDDETRFRIAQEVADSKTTYDARGLSRAGKQLVGKKPKTLISDDLPAFMMPI